MASPHAGLTFAVGLVAGFILSYMAMNYGDAMNAYNHVYLSSDRLQNDSIHNRLFANGSHGDAMVNRHRNPINHEEVEAMDRLVEEYQLHQMDPSRDAHKHADDDHVAKELYNKVRVLVWVMTQPTSLESKARHVNNTWARRANKVLFASDTYDPKFPTMPLEIEHGRDHLTAKTMAAFDYVYEHYYNDYDWFMKADDDTYVVMENLRYFLSNEDTNKPVYFGHWFKVIVKQGYYSGGGGYVLSKEALKRFGTRDRNLCAKDHGAEDVALGTCMEKLGVQTKESVDSLGRSRFHCFNPETHRRGGFPDWYLKYDKYDGSLKGVNGMSDYPITFHYCSIDVMYDLEYYVYHLQPYGIIHGLQNLNKPGASKDQSDDAQHQSDAAQHQSDTANKEGADASSDKKTSEWKKHEDLVKGSDKE